MPKILLVEDNEMNMDMLSRRLLREGYEIVTATDGLRGLSAARAEQPDLTIIAGRPAWPWQDDMISILLHKPNVWNELHGWSPKYLTDALKRCRFNQKKTADFLGLTYHQLRGYLRKYELSDAEGDAEGTD